MYLKQKCGVSNEAFKGSKHCANIDFHMGWTATFQMEILQQ
jgi:hypothetical protein